MSLVDTHPPRELATANPTGRRLHRAMLLTGAAVLVSCLIYVIEKYGLRPRRRFLESPVEVIMRAFAVAHFLVGWLFLASSPRIRSSRSLLRLSAAGLAGAGACWMFNAWGGAREPWVLLAFYALFLIHEMRDERELARHDGTIPNGRFADVLGSTTIVALVLLLAGMHLARGWLFQPDHLPDISPLLVGGALAGVGLVLAWLLYGLIRTARREHGSLHEAVEAHLPLIQVYQILAVILFLGSLLGSTGLNLIILIHVTVWLVFVAERLGQQKGEGWFAWVRETRVGFLTLHLGLVVVMMGLFAVRVHVWERGGWFSPMLSSSSFPYWSIMHICLAFGGRR